MKIFTITKPLQQMKGDILVLPYLDGKLLSHPLIKQVETKLSGTIAALCKKTKFEGGNGCRKLITSHGRLPFDYVLILGMGDTKNLTLESFRKAASRTLKVARKLHVHTIASALSLIPTSFPDTEVACALTEGAILGGYKFKTYKTKKDPLPNPEVMHFILSGKTSVQKFTQGVRRGETLAQGVYLSRDLGNIPAADKPPLKLAQIALRLKGVRVRVFRQAQLKKMKMNGILVVGKGSVQPPVFVEMIYRPKGRSKKVVALVGKGITFDSGGLSLKPPKGMEGMKDDMSGAGNVIAIMQVLTQLKPNVEVRGYFAAAENMPSGTAQRPGDVYRAHNGITVEVLNTDAEGRLVLGDALSYASDRKPDYLIDMATLTGACVVALGEEYAGILGNDTELIKKIIQAGNYCGEKIWELPLAAEYEDELKSTVADIKNIGGAYAGTINGALFLKHFVGKSKWAHLDIAGPSFSSKELAYCSKGATGFLVRTMVRFISNL